MAITNLVLRETSGYDANKHLDKFLHVTQSIKVNGVTDDALHLYLFPHSLTHHATAWFDRLPRNSITTIEQMAKMFLEKYFSPSMVTKLRNEITNFPQRPDESLFKAWECYKLSIDRCPNHNMLPFTQIDTFYNGLTLRHRDTINAAADETFMKRRSEECYDLIEYMTAHYNDLDTSSQRSESSSFITSSSDSKIVALKADMAEINKNLMKVLQINQQVKAVTPSCETCGGPHSYNDCPATVGQTQNANDAILKNMQTNMTSLTNFNLELKNMFGQFMKMNTASSSGLGTLPSNTITNPKEDLKGITNRSGIAYKGPTIPTTYSPPKVVERETEVTKDMVPLTNNESTRDVQPSVVKIETQVPNSKPVVAPVVEPVVAPASALKPNPKPSIPYPSRLNDQKLRDKANDQMEKFFQIFQDLNFNISFVNALILMPKFASTIKSLLTNKEKLFELARTPLNGHCLAILLEKLPEKLGDPGKFLIPYRSISRPVGVAEDVFVKVGKFHFPVDIVVVDFDADPRVPLILERSFLKIGRALIDVYEGELTLRVGNKALVRSTLKKFLDFPDSDFLLEETDAFLAIEDEPISSEIDDSYYDLEGDILLFEEFLNDDPSSPPLPPQELKVVEPKNEKSSIDESPMVELKQLPPQLEYVFLEGDDKLPVIITKDLKDEEKTALIKVLKSHKLALAWPLSDIKGINPEFYTHKILMKDDFKPAV
nr:reverse transcriptase domain-containing protein [Tanacetum cinerariifolium]